MTAGELLNLLLPRIGEVGQNLEFVKTLQVVSDLIAERLWSSRNDLIKTDLSADVTAESNAVTLPSGFLGLASNPYLVDADATTVRTLLPLRSNTKHQYEIAEPGSPDYYELRGQTTIYLYPTPADDWTMKGEMFQSPQIADLTDDVPYSGLFDNVFMDAVLTIGKQGLASTVDSNFQAFIRDFVDEKINYRSLKTVVWRYPA